MTMIGKAWIDIGAIDDIPRKGARVLKTPAGCVAVFRTVDDEVYALDDKCPHSGGPLSQGIVHARSVTCPLHNWVINLGTGLAEGADVGTVRTYPLRLEKGRLLLDAGALGTRGS
jgi:nitrite reductase (NADH) small subunit